MLHDTLIQLYQLRNEVRESMFEVRNEYARYHDVTFYHKMTEHLLNELTHIDRMIDNIEVYEHAGDRCNIV
jgi:uncharacterized protein Yka (UPF0111/DUF47 family)